MRVIIAGSRDVTAYNTLLSAIEKAKEVGIIPTVVISGTARGVDQMGEEFANANSILVKRYVAEWDIHGKKAGYLRNEVMAANADALIALWDEKSRGTKHMIDIAKRAGLKILVWCLDGKNYNLNCEEQNG